MKLPMIHIRIDKSKVLATPNVIILAIQCWKPQKINKGIPYMIPKLVPFLYINTAIYIMAPHNKDLIKISSLKLILLVEIIILKDLNY